MLRVHWTLFFFFSKFPSNIFRDKVLADQHFCHILDSVEFIEHEINIDMMLPTG